MCISHVVLVHIDFKGGQVYEEGFRLLVRCSAPCSKATSGGIRVPGSPLAQILIGAHIVRTLTLQNYDMDGRVAFSGREG